MQLENSDGWTQTKKVKVVPSLHSCRKQLQGLDTMGDFNDLDIFWKGNIAGYEQYKRFLECVDDNYLIQDIDKPI